jgi:hypothetical protein
VPPIGSPRHHLGKHEEDEGGDNLTKLRQQYTVRVPRRKPSSAGIASIFAKQQENLNKRIYFSRPFEAAATTPVTILHPIFGQFIDDCERYVPTKEDNALTWKLSEAMSKWCTSEKDRLSSFLTVMAEHDYRLTTTKVNRYETDA